VTREGGNLFVEPHLVTLLPGAIPCVTFQHSGGTTRSSVECEPILK